MTVTYSQIEIDPFPLDPNGASFFVQFDSNGDLLISDNEHNELLSMPKKVLVEILARLDDLDVPVDIVVPVDDEEVPF